MQFEGRNYLLGTDAELRSEFDIQAEAMDLGQVTRLIRQSSRAALIFVDACRDNPVATNFYRRTLPATRTSAVQGLAAPRERFDGAMLTFSASPGQVAYDGQGAYSPFAQALAEHLPTPNTEILTLMKRVIGDVRAETDDLQVPMVSNDLSREIFLKEVALRPENVLVGNPLEAERAVFDAAKKVQTLHAWARYFDKYPRGRLYAQAISEEHEVHMREASFLSAGFATPEPLDSIPASLASRFEERLGIDREDIIAIQVLLRRAGYYQGTLDGLAGPGTRAAITAYQTDEGLPVTGMITRATAYALGLDLKKLANRPGASGFRSSLLRKEDAELLGMDPNLFAHQNARSNGARMVYGYRDNRLYVATIFTQGNATVVHRNVDANAKVYPVSVNSSAENRLISELVRYDRAFWEIGRDNGREWWHGPLIGLWQPPGESEPASGWTFAGDGENAFRRWEIGQPDDWGAGQDFVRLWHFGDTSKMPPDLPNGLFWDDTAAATGAIIFEVELD